MESRRTREAGSSVPFLGGEERSIQSDVLASSLVESIGQSSIQLSGHTIKVPHDCYGALQDATVAKVAFLPTSKIAVRVDTGRGIGLS